MICRTYPFYLDNDVLRCSECSGIGIEKGPHDAEIIAACLLERCVIEIEESIALLEKYQDFERGMQKKGQALIVHDSEGEHRIT